MMQLNEVTENVLETIFNGGIFDYDKIPENERETFDKLREDLKKLISSIYPVVFANEDYKKIKDVKDIIKHSVFQSIWILTFMIIMFPELRELILGNNVADKVVNNDSNTLN